MKLKHIISAILLAIALTGCREETGEKTVKPDASAALREEVKAERKSRLEAEAKAEKEAGSKSRWEMAAFALGVAALATFVGGTAIGSRGKRHAARS
jgi:hypothetical protein